MSQITVEVEIDHGKIIPPQPGLRPESGRGMLTISTPDEELNPLVEEPNVLPLWKPDQFPARRMARKAGIDRGKFVVPDDFNDPFPDEFWGL